MNFIVSSNKLLKNLQSISGVIGTNNILPIVENFKFVISNNKLRATATDLETSMSVEIEVQSKDNATICLEAKLLLDYLKNLSEQPLSFEINMVDYSVELTSDEGKYKMVGENADHFPKAPQEDGATSFSMLSSRLISGINNTLFAVSSDELRPAMTGVFLEIEKTHITMVATDAHRLVRYMIADVKCPEAGALIIPRKPLGQLKNVLSNDDTQVNISYNKEHLFVRNDKIELACRLIDAKFPDYKVVIPQNNPYLLNVNRVEFLNALRRVGVFANKTTNQLVLKISGSELRITAQDVDFAHEGNERMACQYTGEDLDIAFNGKLLTELVNTIEAEELNIELSTSSRAGIIKPGEAIENEDLLMLIMPLMLNS